LRSTTYFLKKNFVVDVDNDDNDDDDDVNELHGGTKKFIRSFQSSF